MIDASGTSATSQYLVVIGPLCGVVIGAGLTWLIQRNEWGRQRRWELRRDAVLDAVRCLSDLEDAVLNLDNALTRPAGEPTEEARTALDSMRIDAYQQLRKCSSAYKRAHIVADLAVGGQVSKTLSAYFQLALKLSLQSVKQNSSIPSNERKELALRGNAVIISAREALGIKDAGDLPLLDGSN